MAKIQSDIIVGNVKYLFELADKYGKTIKPKKNGSFYLHANGKKYIVLNEKGEY